MSSTGLPVTNPAPVSAPVTNTKPSVGNVIDTVLHDVILTGVLAASIFVKNAAHQQTASLIINAMAQLLPVLDAQLNGTPKAN